MIRIDSVSVTPQPLLDKLNYGRKRIILNYNEVTPENFLEVFELARAIHTSNQRDCEYLINVFLGKQDILNRAAPNTSNINNKTVVNYAYPITREIVGYTYGSPAEIVQKKSEDRDEVQLISDMFSSESVYTVDTCAAIYDSICGIGYEITLPNPNIDENNIPKNPILFDFLDPRYTFVVQSTDIGNPQILSCMETFDSNGNNKKYIAFNDKYKFTLTYNDSKPSVMIEDNPIGLDPITVFENSLFLTGDWEQALSVMNALNQVTSDSLNDIEGTIKSLLVLIGCDLDSEDIDKEEVMKNIRTKRLLSITNGDGTNGNLDAKFISPSLDSTSVENIREFLEDARNVITGIPDRSANSSGGDTGEAVLNRDGWTDIEIVAKLKEMFFKKSKKKQLNIVLNILKQLDIISDNLDVIDIEVNIGRHTTDNLGTKTTAFSTLVATGELATIDCLEMSGLTTRVNEVVERGEKAKQQRKEESLKYMRQQSDLTDRGLSQNDVNTAKSETE